MAKDEYIGIRVSKEFKKFLQRESKRKGMSLSDYIEHHAEDNFKNTKKHIENLVERAKEDRPEFWQEAEKAKVMIEFEKIIPYIVSEILHPIGNDPHFHSVLLLNFIPEVMKATVVNFDSIADEHKMQAASKFLLVGQTLAENLNKLKVNNKEEQKIIIGELKKLIENFAFFFTSIAFAKDSFLKIKDELDKTEKILIKDLQK